MPSKPVPIFPHFHERSWRLLLRKNENPNSKSSGAGLRRDGPNPKKLDPLLRPSVADSDLVSTRGSLLTVYSIPRPVSWSRKEKECGGSGSQSSQLPTRNRTDSIELTGSVEASSSGWLTRLSAKFNCQLQFNYYLISELSYLRCLTGDRNAGIEKDWRFGFRSRWSSAKIPMDHSSIAFGWDHEIHSHNPDRKAPTSMG